MELFGFFFKLIGFSFEYKVIFVILFICNYNIFQFLYYSLGIFGYQVESTVVIRFCKVVFFSKFLQGKEEGKRVGMEESLLLIIQIKEDI